MVPGYSIGPERSPGWVPQTRCQADQQRNHALIKPNSLGVSEEQWDVTLASRASRALAGGPGRNCCSMMESIPPMVISDDGTRLSAGGIAYVVVSGDSPTTVLLSSRRLFARTTSQASRFILLAAISLRRRRWAALLVASALQRCSLAPLNALRHARSPSWASISAGLLRLSVGREAVPDLFADLEHGLAQCREEI